MERKHFHQKTGIARWFLFLHNEVQIGIVEKTWLQIDYELYGKIQNISEPQSPHQ